ncbi:MAG: hypothetical protein K2H86_07065 [Muribaculaceae bacterium]|nr:hypothetical protein [Muribaculaceae bacterium]
MNKFFQPYILGLIREELRRVKEAHVAPVVASHRAIINVIQKDIEEAVNALEKDGLITVARNINQIPLYKIKESK